MSLTASATALSDHAPSELFFFRSIKVTRFHSIRAEPGFARMFCTHTLFWSYLMKRFGIYALSIAVPVGLLTALVAMALSLGGCVASTPQPETASFSKYELPTGVTNVVNKGNNWCEFELDGRKFLYHRSIDGVNEYAVGYECLTELSKLPAEKSEN